MTARNDRRINVPFHAKAETRLGQSSKLLLHTRGLFSNPVDMKQTASIVIFDLKLDFQTIALPLWPSIF